MASDYQVVSAGSEAGEALKIPIGWEVSNPATDFCVYVVPPSGVPELCDYWTWDAAAGELNIPNALGYESWSAYVSRDEKAAMLAAFSATGEVDVYAIVAQLAKNVRVLEQLQAGRESSITAPDSLGGILPVGRARAGFFLSFDEEGRPSCKIEFAGVELAQKAAENAAVSALNSAHNAAKSAKDAVAAKNASEEAKAACGTLKSQAETAKAAAETAKGQSEKSAQSASTSATNALTSATNASNSSSSASMSAQSAGNSASAAASSASSADASAQQAAQDRAAAELAAQNAQEISDPDGLLQKHDAEIKELAAGTAVNSSDLAALCRRAANVGFFEFNGGYLGVPDGAAKINSLPMSICITYNVKEWNLATRINLLLSDNNRAGISLWLGDQSNPFLDFMIKNPSGSSRQRLRTTALPAGLHTLVVAVGGTISGGAVALEYFIDGIAQTVANPNVVKTLADTDMSASGGDVQIGTAQSNTAGAVSLSAENWNLSRVKIFNFDISAEGAPYTVADYAAGLECIESGLYLNLPEKASAFSTSAWQVGAAATASETESGGLALSASYTGADANYGVYFSLKLPFPLRANDVVKISAKGTVSHKLRLSLRYSEADSSLYASTNFAASTTETDYSRNWTIDSRKDGAGILSFSASAVPAGEAVSAVFSKFTLKINGALLNLSDAADASQIRDESGNGNHALISGTVLPSKSNNPAHCAQTITWAGTSTLQNVCGDSAIPANSKVTAYAKATGALTASFKAGANTAQSKELAANTLTEIGSWLCEASGAFSVQPSAAYTGSIETYLTIERL